MWRRGQRMMNPGMWRRGRNERQGMFGRRRYDRPGMLTRGQAMRRGRYERQVGQGMWRRGRYERQGTQRRPSYFGKFQGRSMNVTGIMCDARGRPRGRLGSPQVQKLVKLGARLQPCKFRTQQQRRYRVIRDRPIFGQQQQQRRGRPIYGQQQRRGRPIFGQQQRRRGGPIFGQQQQRRPIFGRQQQQRPIFGRQQQQRTGGPMMRPTIGRRNGPVVGRPISGQSGQNGPVTRPVVGGKSATLFNVMMCDEQGVRRGLFRSPVVQQLRSQGVRLIPCQAQQQKQQ